MIEEFRLKHEEGRLFAYVVVRGEEHSIDITEYMEESNAHDDWLDYRLGLNKG